MKFGKKFIYYQIPEWSEYYLDYFSIKTLLKFIDTRKSKKNSITKLKKLKHHFSEDIRKKKRIQNSEILNSLEPLQLEKVEKSFPNIKKKNLSISSNNINKKISSHSSLASDTTTINLEKKKTLTPEMKKKIIEKIEDMSLLNNSEKSKNFCKFYEEKLKIVNDFFIWKLDDYEQKFLNTKNKIDNLREQKEEEINNNNSKNNNSDNSDYINVERDEFDFATSWKRALSSLFNFTSWLHSFHNINLLAIKKIKKKAKKIFDNINIRNIDKKLDQIDLKFPFFNLLSQVNELRKKINALYAEYFYQGNLNHAKEELDIKLRGENKLSKKTIIWFYYGCIIFSIIFYLFLIINKPQKNYSIKPFFPAFSFFLGMIFLFFGISINLLVLQKFKINYLYIFEILHKFNIGFSDVYEISLSFTTFFCFMMIGAQITYNYELFGNNFYIFPLITIIFFFVFLLNPFKIFSYKLRKGLILNFFKILFPFGKKSVLFKDFIYCDSLCSLTMPFCSLAITICMLLNKDCKTTNFRPENCNRDMKACFIITLYPFCIRVIQVINRLYYSLKFWPHLINIFKYISTIIFILFAYLHCRDKFNEHPNYDIFKVIFGVIQTLFQIFWDIYLEDLNQKINF